jgi:hypothetical protein
MFCPAATLLAGEKVKVALPEESVVKASGASAVEFTVKVVAACAGSVGMRLKAAIIPAASSPAARALVFLLNTDTSLFVWVGIFLRSFLPPSSGGSLFRSGGTLGRERKGYIVRGTYSGYLFLYRSRVRGTR